MSRLEIIHLREELLLELGEVEHVLDADGAIDLLRQTQVRSIADEVIFFLQYAPQRALGRYIGQGKHHFVGVEDLAVEVGLGMDLLFLGHDVGHLVPLVLFLLGDDLLVLFHETQVLLDDLRLELGIELKHDALLL